MNQGDKTDGGWTGEGPTWEEMAADPDIRRAYGAARIFFDAQIALGKLGSWKEVEVVKEAFEDWMELANKKESTTDESDQHNARMLASRIRTITSESTVRSGLLQQIIDKLQAMNERFKRTAMIAKVTADSAVDFAGDIGRGSRS